MTERIIPIQIEGRESDNQPEKVEAEEDNNSIAADQNDDGDGEQKLSESMEQLAVDQPVKKPVVQVKSLNTQQEYLKEFDVMEKRDSNVLLSDYQLPNADSVEKIFLIIDRAQDENVTPFNIGAKKYTPLAAIKRAVNIFLTLKHNINPHHEFAIIVLNESDATLVINFTSDLRKLKEAVSKITECETEDIFNLNSLFKIITEYELPSVIAPEIAPSYVMRAIIFYGRSYTRPQLEPDSEICHYLEYPYFTCDILMTHEPVEAGNNCVQIFELLQNLDTKGTAYFFPVGRDLRRLQRCCGKLLAHPLQRPVQKLIKS
ncbi:BRISC and BRCA1-A complex member 1-like [Cylas formicarius]|uniref:BRISC and BRCA1-A complex member 1-like n=1 Tax=Cylas formicarius TaxID=197179 RepID=UPI0029587B85|nr:BRISC and BRCA1-A complex member 1-like [Cylas formicarius]